MWIQMLTSLDETRLKRHVWGEWERVTCRCFSHSVICRTCPLPLSKRAVQTVRSSASSFNFQYPLASLMPSSSCLRYLPRLPVTSIPPSIFPSLMGFRKQFLRKLRPTQLDFLFCISDIPVLLVIVYFLISPTTSTIDLHLSPAPHFRTF